MSTSLRPASQLTPRGSTASADASVFVSVCPSPVPVTKLRVLALVTFVAFGLMNALAGVFLLLDNRERKRLVLNIKREALGFRSPVPGAWLWDVHQVPVTTEVGRLTGPAVELCAIVGIPFCRFRAAIPEARRGSYKHHTRWFRSPLEAILEQGFDPRNRALALG